MAAPLPQRPSPPPVPSATELQRTVADSATAAPPLEDPKSKREYTFEFRHKDAVGNEWTGTFTNKILSIGDKTAVAAFVARIYGGIPHASVDPISRESTRSIAHMTYSLVKKPKWADDLFELTEEDIVEKLFEEVSSHEITFRGRNRSEGSGQG